MIHRVRFWPLIAALVLALAGCATQPASPSAPAAPAAATATPAAEASAAPVARGDTWINRCEEPAVQGGEVTLSWADLAMEGRNWLSRGSTNESFIHSQLVDLSIEDGSSIIPDVATRWEVSDDGTVYTYYLRDDVYFHDGVQLTAADVKFTIEMIAHPDTGIGIRTVLPLSAIAGYDEFSANEADEITGVQVIDDTTLQITLSGPRADFFYGMGGMNIHPKHIWENIPFAEMTTSPYALDQVIGSGPFKMAEYVPDQYYILEAFDQYYKGRPNLDRLIFRIGLSSVASWLPGLETGEIQIGSMVNGLDRERAEANPNLTVVGAPLPGAMAIWPNHKNFDDKRILQALFYALDREAIVEGIYGPGQAFVYDYDNIDPNHEWISPNVPKYPYDPDMARQLLADAGWDPNRELEFLTYYQTELDRNVVAAMQQFWADVGVKVNVTHMDAAAWVARVYEQTDFDLGYGCCGISVPFEYSRYSCANVPPAGVNASAYCNPEVDQMVTDAMVEPDPAKRRAMWHTISEITNDELLHITLFQQDRGHAVNKDVCNYQFRQWSNIVWPERNPHTWYLRP